MEQEQLEQNGQSLEENLPMVTYIMLHRIYDLLTLIARNLGDHDEIAKMVEYHDAGYLLGPSPSYTPQDSEEK